MLFHNLTTALLPAGTVEEPRDWLWPHTYLAEGALCIHQPARQGAYSKALVAQAYLHSRLGHTQHFTLHSPRFFIPGIAGQAGFTMEERRAMGRWGPASGMPVRYDQAR